MIEAANLSFLHILHEVSFQLPENKTLAVIGHNGAGKTTLFHVLLGLKFASSGQSSIRESKFGYVPERPYLDMDERLRDFLKLHLKLIAYPKAKNDEEIDRVSRLVGLHDELDKKFKHYSKGMLQKAMLAQAMLGSPKLIFLDEPMSGLDSDSRKELMHHLQTLRGQGVALVFTSHVMEDVSALADLVLVLDHGKQKFFGPTAEWRAS
jgi:ABC-type multidrug transport system ATPase subunit